MRIVVNDLTVKANRKTILKNIHLDCSFQACGLFGPSGSGKSTLLHALFPAIYPEIEVKGDIAFYQQKQRFQPLFGRNVAVIPQNAQSCFDPNVKMKQQLMESFLVSGASKKEAQQKVDELLTQCQLPQHLLNAYPSELSGGMLQSCAVGIALVMKPELVIADEPTSALDDKNRQLILEMMVALKNQGSALLISTHRLEDIEQICDQLIVLNQGEIEGSCDVNQLSTQPLPYVKQVLLAKQKLQQAEDLSSVKTPILLRLQQISKSYSQGWFKTVSVLDKLSFDLCEQENIALMGESGAGKTTLIKLIVGIQSPTSGSLKWQNQREVSMVFQNVTSSVDPTYTVQEVLKETAASDADLVELLAEVGLSSELLLKPAQSLSGGQIQRLCIARAVATKAKLIILDEPFSSLDLPNTVSILDLLKQIQIKHGCTYLLVTHQREVARYLCQKEIYIENNHIQYEGPVRQ